VKIHTHYGLCSARRKKKLRKRFITESWLGNVLGEIKRDYPVKFEYQKWLWHYCVLQKKRWRRAILCGDEMLNVTLSEIVDSVSDI
jgi:hypothetical protein